MSKDNTLHVRGYTNYCGKKYLKLGVFQHKILHLYPIQTHNNNNNKRISDN